MKLNEQVFKKAFGKNIYAKGVDGIKNRQATIHLHYLLSHYGVALRDKYSFSVASDKCGLTSQNCLGSLFSDYDKDPKLPKKAITVLGSIVVALELTKEEIGYEVDERNLVIDGACYQYLQENLPYFHSQVTEENFYSIRRMGNFECAKTFAKALDYCFENLYSETSHSAIIKSSKQDTENEA